MRVWIISWPLIVVLVAVGMVAVVLFAVVFLGVFVVWLIVQGVRLVWSPRGRSSA